MLRIRRLAPESIPSAAAKDANFPAPFPGGLEFSPPARGTWTIMHLGLLIPETHIVFVCAQCCLRGVAMSAAEAKALDRFSTITVEDRNLLEGDTEEVLVDGIADILSKIPYKPRAVLIYTSCVHEFIGSDLTFSFAELRRRFPDIDFADGYMAPIVRKRITPDAKNRRQVCTLLKKRADTDRGVTMIATVRPIASERSDFRSMVERAGLPWRDITSNRTYEEYQALAKSSLFITEAPFGSYGLDWCAKNLGCRTLLLGTPWTPDEIEAENAKLAAALGIEPPDESGIREEALAALARAREALGSRPIAIDFTATARPLSLARLLISSGFTVSAVFADAFIPAEKANFEWLRENAPDLAFYPTADARMADAADALRFPEGTVAVGQKAAWFAQTPFFVNMVEGDGADGWRAVLSLARELEDATLRPKDLLALIRVKALGCGRGGCL